jgi:uracil-DNA glycosylase family 4
MTPLRPSDFAAQAASVLAFYAEAGVDVLLAEAPVDRFTEMPQPRPGMLAAPAGPPPQGAPAAMPAEAVETAQPRATYEAVGTARPPAAYIGPSERPDDADKPPRRFVLGASGPPAAGSPDAPPAPPAPEAAIMAAREAARNAKNLDELRAILASFEGCGLRATARQLVFADGNPRARVMFVGEAPGREEDLEGLPFVGPSGRFLDRMMAAIGLNRRSAYIGNVVPWRPPGNRTPTPQETATCLPFIKRQIELADPDILMCLGAPSAQALLGIKDGIRRSRGRWHVYHTGTRDIRAIATFHPAYLLRSPLEKRLAWRDFLAVKKALAE